MVKAYLATEHWLDLDGRPMTGWWVEDAGTNYLRPYDGVVEVVETEEVRLMIERFLEAVQPDFAEDAGEPWPFRVSTRQTRDGRFNRLHDGATLPPPQVTVTSNGYAIHFEDSTGLSVRLPELSWPPAVDA